MIAWFDAPLVTEFLTRARGLREALLKQGRERKEALAIWEELMDVDPASIAGQNVTPTAIIQTYDDLKEMEKLPAVIYTNEKEKAWVKEATIDNGHKHWEKCPRADWMLWTLKMSHCSSNVDLDALWSFLEWLVSKRMPKHAAKYTINICRVEDVEKRATVRETLSLIRKNVRHCLGDALTDCRRGMHASALGSVGCAVSILNFLAANASFPANRDGDTERWFKFVDAEQKHLAAKLRSYVPNPWRSS
jgi:hypothetical protein